MPRRRGALRVAAPPPPLSHPHPPSVLFGGPLGAMVCVYVWLVVVAALLSGSGRPRKRRAVTNGANAAAKAVCGEEDVVRAGMYGSVCVCVVGV